MRFMIFAGSPAKAARVRSYRTSTRPIRRPAGACTEAARLGCPVCILKSDCDDVRGQRLPLTLTRLR